MLRNSSEASDNDCDTSEYFKRKKLDILLIEDMRSDAELLHQILKRIQSSETPSLTHFVRLDEGIDAIKKKKFDVIILDLSLPDSVGLKTIKTLIPCCRQIPIVVLTGSDDDSLGLQAVEAGAKDYIQKSSFLKGENILLRLNRAIRYSQLPPITA